MINLLKFDNNLLFTIVSYLEFEEVIELSRTCRSLYDRLFNFIKVEKRDFPMNFCEYNSPRIDELIAKGFGTIYYSGDLDRFGVIVTIDPINLDEYSIHIKLEHEHNEHYIMIFDYIYNFKDNTMRGKNHFFDIEHYFKNKPQLISDS